MDEADGMHSNERHFQLKEGSHIENEDTHFSLYVVCFIYRACP